MTGEERDGLSDSPQSPREPYGQLKEGSSQNPRVEDIVEGALAGLGDQPSPDALVQAVRGFREALQGADAVTMTAARHAAIARLERAGKSRGEATELLRAAFEPGRAPADAAKAKLQGQALEFREPERWGEPVQGSQLLDAIVTTLRTFIVIGRPEADAISLWVLHTWVRDAADVSPRLILASPEPRCGKTRLLGVLKALVRRPLTVSGLSGPVLFRSIELIDPTVLADEMDNAKLNHPDKADLLAVLNSGWSRESSSIIRCVGQDLEPRSFNAWTAVALALIGQLPAALEDRGISIAMKRKSRSEKVERLRAGRVFRELEWLRRMAARWARDHEADLSELDVDVPPELDDRAADNWRPLVAIAALSSETWLERARRAALTLSASRDKDELSAGVLLLRDIRVVFDANGADRMSSGDLLASLYELEDAPWSEWNHGRPMSARRIAKLLRPFGISPGSIRLPSGETPKGYLRDWFEEAFSRYLSPESATTPQATPGAHLDDVLHSPHDATCGGGQGSEGPRHSGSVAPWRHEWEERQEEPSPQVGDRPESAPEGGLQ